YFGITCGFPPGAPGGGIIDMLADASAGGLMLMPGSTLGGRMTPPLAFPVVSSWRGAMISGGEFGGVTGGVGCCAFDPPAAIKPTRYTKAARVARMCPPWRRIRDAEPCDYRTGPPTCP